MAVPTGIENQPGHSLLNNRCPSEHGMNKETQSQYPRGIENQSWARFLATSSAADHPIRILKCDIFAYVSSQW